MTELVKLFNKTMFVLIIILNMFRSVLENHVFPIKYSVAGLNHVFNWFFGFWWLVFILLFLGYTITAIVSLHRFDRNKKEAGK